MQDEVVNKSSEDLALEQMLAMVHTLSTEKLIKLYTRTRTAKSAAQKVFDEQDARFKRVMEACSNQLLRVAQEQGVTGFKTEFGTSYIAVDTKISIADAAVFYEFVKAENDLDFFERRVSSRHVEDYMKAHEGVAPPGLNIFRENVMRVRKAQEKN